MARVVRPLVVLLAAALLLAGERAAPAPPADRMLHPIADHTVTAIAQDGDTTAATTLATCPALCEHNPAARRDAALTFQVDGLPRDLTGMRATLRLYAWHDAPARIRVEPGTTADRVRAGFNDFPVPVRANGTYTFAVSQEDHHSRVYWASSENPQTGLRPQLVLSYRTPDNDWELVWNDEFDGTALDRSKWNLRDGEARDIDLGCNVANPANTVLGNGSLTLRALPETVACGSRTRRFTQSYLDTIGRHSWTYGRFEIRARSPEAPAKGIWPAFWLRPDDGGNGEIDVTELPGGPGYDDKATAAIFWDYTPVKQDVRIPLVPPGGWHTYTTEWDADRLTWSIDGRVVWTRDSTTTLWFGKAFRKPYHLRLNIQAGGWLGTPDATTAFPADFVVDYVRVYQR
ncbi:family 16 glycosylhydrolase [Actinoplanes sp. NPDC051494]|uniref:glycoside hydrolase family 16 protein n=1 Tax=Actinoplanes sp. NPDC051494 TaxID=3363907 RepID=UPI0037B5DA20